MNANRNFCGGGQRNEESSHFSQQFLTDQLQFQVKILQLSKTEPIGICINIKKDERNIAVQVC